MSSVTITPPNGILFVFDPTNKNVLVPEYIDGELTASTETCVSVGTQAPVDGETEVSLSASDVPPVGMQQAFLGSIVSPGGKIAIVTAEFHRVLELDVPKGNVGMSIWVNDHRNPSQIVVNIKQLGSE